MCSIIGYCGICDDLDEFQKGFDKTISRGPDDSRIVDTGNGLLGFHRLAIMGLTASGMQPFSLGGSYVVCNGEIFGFERLRESLSDRYTFQSDSDCEVLLPLYETYGTEMFRMLDAEFACIIYDGKTQEYIAARDPIGIRPLYYGYDKKGTIVFASEAKNLIGLCEKIRPFPPGHYYKDGEFVCYCDITKVDEICQDDLEQVCANIREKLVTGIEKRLVADAKVGFLLSGGLDSSLVCAVAARKSKTPIRTFAIGMQKDAIDLKYAKEVADYIGSEHTEVIITKEDVLSALEDVIGGGDTGNDCVGTAIRLGAKSVTQLEMMPRPSKERTKSNPWPQWPRTEKTDYGQEEAIAVFGKDPRMYQTTVKEFQKDKNGNVKKAVLVSLEPQKDKKTGRMQMVPVAGSEKVVDANLVLIAAGFTGSQKYVTDAFGVTVDARTNVATKEETYETNVPGVFAAGDVRRGQSLVVWAIQEGKQVAKAVDYSLMGYTNL